MPFERSAALKRVVDEELRGLTVIAPRGYCVDLHIRRAVPMARYTTINSQWAEHHARMGFVMRDPCLGWASANNGVRRWSEVIDPYGIFAEAARFGLRFGAVAADGPATALSVAIIARHDREVSDAELAELHERLQRLHNLIEAPDRLTRAQLEALRVIAAGKRYAGAAAQLGISESALKARLYSARERLMARTTPEAIRRAKDFGLI